MVSSRTIKEPNSRGQYDLGDRQAGWEIDLTTHLGGEDVAFIGESKSDLHRRRRCCVILKWKEKRSQERGWKHEKMGP